MRWRLLLAFSLVVLVTIISLGFSLKQGALEAVDQFAQRGGFIGADPVVSSLEEFYAQYGSWDGVEEIFTSQNMISNPPGMGNQVGQGNRSGQGNQTGQGMGAGPMMGNPVPINMSLLDSQGNVLVGEDELNGITQLTQDQLQYAIPIRVNQEIVGYLLPPDGAFRRDLNFQTRLGSLLSNAVLRASLIAGALSLALALALGYFLVKPIRTLTLAANKLAEGNLDNRAEVSGPKELVDLGETFNHMADSLQQAERRRQAMTADIAHELRTPLAVQRANLEAMIDGIYPLNEENLAQILEQNTLLTHLVEDLRLLALSDANELRLYKDLTDLVNLTEQVVDQFKPQALKRGIKLKLNLKGTIPSIEIDGSRIKQVLNNLLNNAIRHTPQAGEVTVELSACQENVEINIHDTGEGIPESALPHIFERFYRGDQSRARDRGGSGLGLTIARKLAEAHNGSLTAENHPRGGAVFTLRLPIT